MARKIILCYHNLRTDNDTPVAGYVNKRTANTASKFEQQIAWLASFAEFTDINNIVGTNSDKWQVAITFDDGYRGSFEIGADVLQRYGASATWFVNTRFVEDPTFAPWWDYVQFIFESAPEPFEWDVNGSGKMRVDVRCKEDRLRFRSVVKSALRHSDQRNFETVYARLQGLARSCDPDVSNSIVRQDELLKIVRQHSNVLIGAHTHSHVNTAHCDAQLLDEEIGLNVQKLREWCTGSSTVIDTFAYPYGDVRAINTNAGQILASHGLNLAVTTRKEYCSDNHNPYFLPRLTIQPGWSLTVFKNFIRHLAVMNTVVRIRSMIK